MKNYLSINSLIPSFNKVLNIPGDKSLSIRWVLLASQAIGKSKAYNLLESEDVASAIISMRKLGVEIFKKKRAEIITSFSMFYDLENPITFMNDIYNTPAVLYGGSVDGSNIEMFKEIKEIDGFLIGGASKTSKKFIDIIKNYYR